MKLITLLIMLLLAVSALGQEPVLLFGPIVTDGELGLTLGGAKEVGAGVYIAGLGKFGQTAEAEGELTRLSKIAGRLSVGPVFGLGADWSDEYGTGGEAVDVHLFGVAGIAATFTLAEKVGLWGFWKRHVTDEANDPTLGAGLYFQL